MGNEGKQSGKGGKLAKGAARMTCYAVACAAWGMLALLFGGPKAAEAMTPVAQQLNQYSSVQGLGRWGLVMPLLAALGVLFALGGAMLSGRRRDQLVAGGLLLVAVAAVAWWAVGRPGLA